MTREKDQGLSHRFQKSEGAGYAAKDRADP